MLRTVSVFLCTLFLVYYVHGQNEPEHIFLNDENYTLSSVNYPEPYPKDSSRTWIITVEAGYSISVIITSFDIDSENGDFLIIKPGTTINDQNSGTVFTYKLKNVKKYILESNNVLISFRVLGDNANKKGGFSLILKREGVLITTQTPEIEITWPTPPETEQIYFTGNVSGRAQNDYSNETVLNNLKSAIAQMATEYCIAQAIPFIDSITYLNVHVKELISCPYEWPNSSICVKIRFSLPIFLNQTVNTTGYELTSSNIELMWNQHADKALTQISLSLYTPPDTSTELMWWVGISVAVLIILVFVIIISVIINSKTVVKVKHRFSRRSSDTNAIITDDVRSTITTLPPSEYQPFPPFFDREQQHAVIHEPRNRTSTGYHFNDEDLDNNVLNLRMPEKRKKNSESST
ncbi:hypothetical protein FQR65_LT00768 [Abscondita terminalis]|nr:hypothetical protein FQR65_LT00768 [Abscondita terminalis]